MAREETMKTKRLASVLLIAVLLAGCAKNIEVRPGVYMSKDPSDLPFPTSGYTVYIVGESHGNRQTKLVFQSYLNKLYNEAGLRDIILEEDQAYEAEANEYIHGLTDKLPKGLCLRADVLGQIREFNSNLPDDEKVTVHLVDVDSPFPIIYKHLTELYSQIGPAGKSVQIPDLSEIQYAKSEKTYELVDRLRAVSAERPDILNGLDTVYLSLEWYYIGNLLDVGWPSGSRATFAPIREDIITKNIKYILPQLKGKPVLAFFGLAHGMKIQADPTFPDKEFKSWAQRLVEENVDVYSIAMFGVSGNSFWHGEAIPNDGEFLKEFKLIDGTSLVSLFDTHPDPNITYIDLRKEDNKTIKLSPDLLNIPASQIFDGVILFKEFTPMEDSCFQ